MSGWYDHEPAGEMTPGERCVLTAQIGAGNVLAISGGRVRPIAAGVALPVSAGYSVEVTYDRGADLYTVERVFTRGGRRWVKGSLAGVYADQVGEAAYRASCFRDGAWPAA